MTIDRQEQLEGLKKSGAIVRDCLRHLAEAIEPGIQTSELDQLAARYLEDHGAKSAPLISYNFPGTVCISVNNEAAHGVPGNRVLKPGDLVNIDVSAEHCGYFTDTGASFAVGPITKEARALLSATKSALRRGLSRVRTNRPIASIGGAVEAVVRRAGFRVIRDLTGHGVGSSIHEPPTIANFRDPDNRERLHKGLVIAVEPIVSTGPEYCETQDDGWTLAVEEGHLCAQFEHSVVVTDGRPILLTA